MPIIELYYYISDSGDGSASVRFYANKEKAESDFAAHSYNDATESLNEGEVQTILLDSSDFSQVKMIAIPHKYYNVERPSAFDKWYLMQDFSGGRKEDWKEHWDILAQKGIDFPGDFLETLIDLAADTR